MKHGRVTRRSHPIQHEPLLTLDCHPASCLALQVYASRAGDLVLAARQPLKMDERPVLEELLRALHAAAKSWLEHNSAQCLVRRAAAMTQGGAPHLFKLLPSCCCRRCC